MPGISIHVVDVSRGLVATGMRVELHALETPRRLVAAGTISSKGLLEEESLGVRFAPGEFKAFFCVAAYYREHGIGGEFERGDHLMRLLPGVARGVVEDARPFCRVAKTVLAGGVDLRQCRACQTAAEHERGKQPRVEQLSSNRVDHSLSLQPPGNYCGFSPALANKAGQRCISALTNASTSAGV